MAKINQEEYEVLKERQPKTKRVMASSRLGNIHYHMKGRCNNKEHQDYKDYGGRGIKLCEEWGDLAIFAEWALSNGYEDNLTIDRIDNDGDYEPNNCRWITMGEQSLNRRPPKTNKSGYPGVFFDKRINKYSVSAKKNFKQYYLGSFDNLKDAIDIKRGWEKEERGKCLYEMPTEQEIKNVEERNGRFTAGAER